MIAAQSELPHLLSALHEEARRRAPPDLEGLAHPRTEPAPQPDLVAWLHERRNLLAFWLSQTVPPSRPGHTFAEDPAAHLTFELVRSLLARNQFLPIDGQETKRLEEIHARSLSALRKALAESPDLSSLSLALTNLATAYREELASFVSALGPDAGKVLPDPLREVVSAQYRPELQLEVLGLCDEPLLEPILDLGCGTEAHLVRWLRKAGKEALGVDRWVEPGPGLLRADWMEVPLPPKSLGTLVSHLAFSLHFLHHHLRQGDGALRYARRYMDLLRALRPGGVFAYAPGLPFVEEHLDPKAFEVERREVPLPKDRSKLAIPWYASRVRRRSS